MTPILWADIKNGDVITYNIGQLNVFSDYTYLIIDKDLRENGQCINLENGDKTWCSAEDEDKNITYFLLDHIDLEALQL